MKLNCAYRDTDGWCLKYSTFNVDVRCDGNPNCAGFAEDFCGDTNVPTNADHIRSMTDEELAKRNVRKTISFVENGQSGYYANAWHASDGTVFASRGHAVGYELYWLKQPYKEG